MGRGESSQQLLETIDAMRAPVEEHPELTPAAMGALEVWGWARELPVPQGLNPYQTKSLISAWTRLPHHRGYEQYRPEELVGFNPYPMRVPTAMVFEDQGWTEPFETALERYPTYKSLIFAERVRRLQAVRRLSPLGERMAAALSFKELGEREFRSLWEERVAVEARVMRNFSAWMTAYERLEDELIAGGMSEEEASAELRKTREHWPAASRSGKKLVLSVYR